MVKNKAITVACAAVCTFGSALAQTVDDNAVKQAEDAFGTKVGQEDIGLYSIDNARGFDPQDAGNMRLEGLYFDQRNDFLCGRIQKSATIRVGLPAQRFGFPAPTGIVDISIFQPGSQWLPELTLQYQQPTGLSFIGATLQAPLTDNIGVYGGLSYVQDTDNDNGTWEMTCGAFVGRLKAGEKLEIIPFYTYNDRWDDEVSPQVLTSDTFVPPHIDRTVFYGQTWATQNIFEATYGTIVRAHPSDSWTINAGLFNSIHNREPTNAILFRNTSEQGVGSLDIVGFPSHSAASFSGEVRATGVYLQGKSWQHTIDLSVRGRDTERRFGGGQTINFGPRHIGINDQVVEPDYTYGTRDIDHVRQITPGVAYAGRWANVGAFSVGVQKSFYQRDLSKENGTPVRTESEPWLYYSTIALYATEDMTLFGSYMRGLEEFGVAPDNAVNSGEPLPASVTQQTEAGVRYQIAPGLAGVASVFEIKKPYFGRNTADIFTDVGQLSHRGLELSVAGRLSSAWTLVTGALFLKPRIAGLPVEEGRLAEVPIGTPLRNVNINVQFSPPSWEGAALDATTEITGRYYADRLNTLRMPSYTTLNVGARYPLQLGGMRGVLRVLIYNITNTYAWTVNGASGGFSPIASTSYMARLVVDL